MTKEPLAKVLTYAGLLPFLACAILAWFTDDVPFISISISDVILAYATVIASFIAGIHWGIFLFKDTPMNLFIHSNVIALLAWLSLLVPTTIGSCILIFCFGFLLYIDHTNCKSGAIEAWFFRLRIQATTLVIIALAAFLVSQLR